MASAETKLVSVSRIVLRAAVFISLSELRQFCSRYTMVVAPEGGLLQLVVVSADGGRCYWCGPLAEQVHRSRRAPPCGDTNTHVTECDPGFPHCAVVATSPPYVESRYCVKFYQDECYSLYCNSTKTWRMTCPCRGDLCNGPNTEREHEAFAVLIKLVAKTNNTRIKRALISSPEFININRNNEIKNATVDEITTHSANDSVTIGVEIMATQSIINVTSSLTDQAAVNNTNDQMQSDQPANNIDDETTTNINDLSKPTINSVVNDTNNNDKESKTDLQTTTVITPQTVNKQMEPTKPTELTKDVMKLADKVKPSPLPTAEARQHDQTPAGKHEKNMNPTTISRNIDVTTEATMRANNTATRIDTHLITLAIGIILQY